jgi:hypothetical protein
METLWALAVAVAVAVAVVLGVPFGTLVEPPTPVVRVIRVDEGPSVHSEQSSYTAALLAAARRTPGVTSTASDWSPAP